MSTAQELDRIRKGVNQVILDACYRLDRLFDDVEDAGWRDWGETMKRLEEIEDDVCYLNDDMWDFYDANTSDCDLQAQISAINDYSESIWLEVRRLMNDIEMHTEEDDPINDFKAYNAEDDKLAERIRDIAAATRAKVTAPMK